MSQDTVVDALAAALRSTPGRPLITVYEATGGRVELSLATFDNWVSKLANLYCLDWGLTEGDLLSLSLPPGWRAAVALVAGWTASLRVTFEPDPGAAAAIRRWDDIAPDVPTQPDLIVLPRVVRAGQPALVEGSSTATHAELVSRGLAAAAAVGLEPGGRLITDLPVPASRGLDIALLAPLVSAASIVVVPDTSAEHRERLAEQEGATCRHWGSG